MKNTSSREFCKHGHPWVDSNIYIAKDGRKLCKVCTRARATEYAKQKPERVAATRRVAHARILGKSFGISAEEVLMRRQQPCEICGLFGDPRHGLEQCHLDHDHTTNKLRGSLCSSCNLGLGKFKDSETLLALAINYLRRYKDATS